MGGSSWIHCHLLPVKFPEIHPRDYGELARLVASRLVDSAGPVVFGIAGAQGTGKSTFTGMLADELSRNYSEPVASLSLDDFYLTRDERISLSKDIHPLLLTRGVPGTHDAALMQSTIEQLRAGEAVEIPVFDKAIDDRESHPRLVGPARIVLCEGWCWGARPEPEARLQSPVNALEAEQDADGQWRRWVNAKLLEYQSLFTTDGLLFLAAPSFESILEWRWQQEQDLARDREGSKIMTLEEIAGFVAFYQRITSWMLEEMPARADIIIMLGEGHQIEGATIL